MMQLDMTAISKQVKSETPEGFEAVSIRVNLDHITPDIEPEERPKVIGQFDRFAKRIIGEHVSVVEDYRIDQLWQYKIRCSCGNGPLYDEVNEEFYCPNCESQEEQKGILDF